MGKISEVGTGAAGSGGSVAGGSAKLLTNAIDAGKSYMGISGAPMYTGALTGLFA